MLSTRKLLPRALVALALLVGVAVTLPTAGAEIPPASPRAVRQPVTVELGIGCDALFDWVGGLTVTATTATVAMYLPAGCAETFVSDGWPLGAPWPAGPVPSDHATYAVYSQIRQGPQSQRLTHITGGGWTTITFTLVLNSDGACQLDVSHLAADGLPLYPAGSVVAVTPNYGDLLVPGGAWVVACPLAEVPPTTTSTTAPPVTTTSTPTTSTTTTTPGIPTTPETVVAPPTLAVTGLRGVTVVAAILGFVLFVAGCLFLFVTGGRVRR